MELYIGFVTAGFFGMLFLLIKSAFKIRDLKHEIRHYRYHHGQIIDFIHQWANLRDDQGNSSGSYDSKQVAKRWEEFIELERDFYHLEDSDVQ